MNKKPEIISTHEAAKTALFRVEKVALRFSNGEEREYERLGTFNSPIQAVMVVPVTDDGCFLMVEEYAVGTESYEINFPKGLVDPGESLFEGAERELKEEAGFGANSLKFMTEFALSPHYMCHKINVVLAQSLYAERLPGDEPETMPVHKLSWDKAMALVDNKKLIDVRTIAALYMARDFLAGKK